MAQSVIPTAAGLEVVEQVQFCTALGCDTGMNLPLASLPPSPEFTGGAS